MAKLHNAHILFAMKVKAAQIAAATTSEQVPQLQVVEESATETAPPPPAATTQLNANSASAEELETLPVIGAVLAARVVVVREDSAFADFNDFKARLNLNKKQASELEAHLTF